MQAPVFSFGSFCAQTNPRGNEATRWSIVSQRASPGRAVSCPRQTHRISVDGRRPSRRRKTATSALSFLSRPKDPGDWEFSPEWYGSQGGGYGRDDGAVVYRSGDVEVTSHASSGDGTANGNEDGGGGEGGPPFEWRVLRFGGATRQSVCRVSRGSGLMDPTCLAFEYTKTLVALALALLPLPLPPRAEGRGRAGGAGEGEKRGASRRRGVAILCVGVGGGSVPAALAALRPDAEVSAFEVDERVVGSWPETGLVVAKGEGEGEGQGEGQGQGQGEGEGETDETSSSSSSSSSPSLPAWTQNLRLAQQCGAEAVAAVAAAAPGSLDLLIVDAFDNRDQVPSIFTDPSSDFFENAERALSPRGAVLINLHCGPRPGPAAALAAMFSFDEKENGSAPSSVAFDASRGEGKEAVAVARSYSSKLLGASPSSSSSASASSATAFLVAARRQQNAIGVVARAGLLALRDEEEDEEPSSPPPPPPPPVDASSLAAAASRGAAACAVPLPFDVGSRANYGLLKL